MSSQIENSDRYEPSVDLYYKDEVPEQLRNALNSELGKNYTEKYIRSVFKDNEPMMVIELPSETISLFGDEINLKNINQILSEKSEIQTISDR